LDIAMRKGKYFCGHEKSRPGGGGFRRALIRH
jgi:hypothetical protein